MATTSPWPLIHAEREAVVADLGTLTDEQWATPSLCDGWTVRDVLGHMISTAKMTPPRFFTSMPPMTTELRITKRLDSSFGWTALSS